MGRRRYEPETEDEIGAEKSIPDYETVPGLRRSKLDEIVDRCAEIGREIDALEKEENVLKAAGVDLLLRNNTKSVMVNGRLTTRIDGNTVSYPIAKLVIAGVTDAQLAAAKTETPWMSLKVGKTDEEKAEAAAEKAEKAAKAKKKGRG